MSQQEMVKLRSAAEQAVGVARQRPGSDELASALEELRIHGAELEIQNEELRTSRTELERSQQRYFRHFDLAPVGMIRLNSQGVIVEANILGAKMLGIERARLCSGKVPLSPHLSGDSHGTFHTHLASALASRKMESCEVRLRAQSGEETLVCMQSVASAGAGEAPDLIVTLTDLTEHQRAEAGRMELERQLLEARRLENIGTIAGGIAHDLNNILQVILSNLEMATGAEAGTPLLPLVEEASRATRRASRLSDRLLTFSKGGSPVKQTVEVAEILGSTVVLALSGSQLKVAFFIQPDMPPIHVDPVQFAQVLENVVINAREATSGAGKLAVRVDTVRRFAGNFVRIAFEDHGTGIHENVRDKIFDVCFTTKPAGSGIGLATAKSIMEQHGGSIEVQSAAGRGCTVTLLLPATEPGVGSPPAAAARIKRGSGRILLVDDEETIRKIVPRLLEKIGYECVTAWEGAEGCTAYARAQAEGRPFAAVLLDATIPGGLGGEAALRLILQADPGARVILCSGYADSDVMTKGLALGFKARLPKPFDIARLAEVLSTVLA